MSDEIVRLKIEKLKALEAEIKLREALPHIYSQKHYQWSHDFENDWTNKIQVLCAANQLGKSTSLIKKVIRVATEPETWDAIWPDLKHNRQRPTTFWYLYPSKDVATMEFEEKWRPLLPQVPDDDPIYGWWIDMRLKYISVLHFNTGVNIYFKTYAQDPSLLQAGSVYLLACDEEVPAELLPELQTRTNATNGFLFFVFTATMGQQFWKEVVEDRTQWKEAKVRQVSLYDSQFYIDGSPSRWTNERIQQAVSRCISKAEVDRRIYGRFVIDAGRLFPNWDRETHFKPWHHVPKEWVTYAGIDHGSGGENNHPAAITFIAVSPDMDKVRVIKHWRGDKIQTTAQDVINKFLEMTTGMGMPQTIYYDYSARDLGILGPAMGLPFEKANKSTSHGSSIVNLLLKQQALIVYKYTAECPFPEDHMQGHKLAEEMEMLHDKTDKKHAKDDSTDSLRYAVSSLAFNYEMITGVELEKKAKKELLSPADERMLKLEYKEPDLDNLTVDEEIEFWADLVE